jgi:HSP20 family protein
MATIVRWNPFREMAASERALDEAWRVRRPTASAYALPIDLYETEQAFVLHANVPGLNPEQIQVHFEDGVLTINAEVAQPTSDEKSHILVRERAYGRFARSIRLTDTVDTDNVEAVYHHGVLTLTLPKTPEAQPKQIPVKFSSPLLDSKN